MLSPWSWRYEGPLRQHDLTLIWTWRSNQTHYKMWDEIQIAYPFPNFSDAFIEVWKWVSNFIPHFAMHVITYPCWGWSYMLILQIGCSATSYRTSASRIYMLTMWMYYYDWNSPKGELPEQCILAYKSERPTKHRETTGPAVKKR